MQVEDAHPSQEMFRLDNEYARTIDALKRTGILNRLPGSNDLGVVGIDGEEYPVPTMQQVVDLFAQNAELVERKALQGFDRLELTPLAISTTHLIDLMRRAIIEHGKDGNIFQTRRCASDPFIPVRVNSEKHVWVWERLGQKLDTDEPVYFPREYSIDHRGLSKLEVINDRHICAVPGWSVGLVESSPVMPHQGEGRTLGGRRQLEIGRSPREYLQTLQADEYQGETGKTLEDFITKFLVHLETTNEVSNDRKDENCLWCLGQYIKIEYAECVPTGRWERDIGRVRLDMHRTGNKQCAKSWGCSTVVRLGI